MSSAFTKIGETKIEGIQATAELYIHKKHGCPFLNIKNDDTNNFFSISFRTYPENDKGIAHVTEHMVLHGSEKYPITDVFSEIDKRSINTYLNAYTYPDLTCYPVGSANEIDFHNIMDVYLDCVLRPTFRLENFLSECHHLEFQKDQDPTTPLIHAGVVFNEMKGEFSSPDSFFDDLLRMKLLKGTTYEHNYGGDPKAIQNLTRDELIAFHRKFYHPSKSLIYHYGSFDEEKVMKHVDDMISTIEPLDESEEVKDIKLTPEPRKEQEDIVIEGPYDSSQSADDQIRAAISWIIGDSTDRTLFNDFDLIESILLGSKGTPLFDALINGKIGASFISEGLSNQTKATTFTVGLKGVTKESLEKFQKVTFDTLQKLVDEGIDKEKIDAGIQQIIINKKNITGRHGLKVFNNINHPWAYGTNPLEVIDNSKELDELKKRVTTIPKYLESVIEEKLLKNPNRIKFVQMPSEEYNKRNIEGEKLELEQIRAKMTPEDDKKCMELSKKLKEVIFEKKENIDALPSFKKEDLDPKGVKYESTCNNNVRRFIQGTNGLACAHLLFKFPVNPKINTKMIRMLTFVIQEIGSKAVSDTQFALMKQMYTLLVSCNAGGFPIEGKEKEDLAQFFIDISGSSLTEDFDKLIEIFRIMLLEPNFDNLKRIDVILKQKINGISDTVIKSGHTYALLHSARALSRLLALKENLIGGSYLRYVKNEIQNLSIEEFAKQLKETLELILSTATCEGYINCTKADMDIAAPKLEAFVAELNKLSEGKKLEADYSFIDKYIEEESKKQNVLFALDSQTNYLASTTKVETFNEEVGKISVTGQLLTSEFINPAIRQKLGAYGAWSLIEEVGGKFSFLTYRDGTPAESFAAIKETLQTSADEITDEMTNNAILQVAKELDSPLSPSARGVTDYTMQFPYEYKQLIRDSAFSANTEEIKKEINKLKNAKYFTSIYGNENCAPEGFIVEKF